MAGRESPANGGYEAVEPALRVRKDLFPEVRLPKLGDVAADADDFESQELLEESVSCVNLETDFEKSIDDIANQKLQGNGALSPPERLYPRPRHRKHKQHSRHNSHSHGELPTPNGYLPQKKKKKRSRHNRSPTNTVTLHVKGGKNLNLVSSSECQEEQDEEEESSEDEVLKLSVKLPLINVVRQSGKPYSHELSQLSTKKSKSKDSVKERRIHAVTPCSGKPRSMLDICSSRSKKKSKKSDSGPTYHSQIVDTNTIKIKIRRTSVHERVPPTQTSISDYGQRKSKKKRAASSVGSMSSGEEYDPARPDTAAAISVAAPKPRHPPTKAKKPNKSKTEKTDKSRVSASSSKASGPQSPWASAMPEEVLVKIFEYVVAAQGSLPSIIRMGKVCKLWHAVSCRPDLWKQVDLAQYTNEKFKTDYKLVFLLEKRLSHCQSLNIAQWKVCNVSWVLACLIEYCPNLVELSVAGWTRLTPEHLFDLTQGLPKLQRLDLSLTSETGGSNTCLSAASMARVAANFGERFTHLTLANNKFTALPQILSSIAAHCPNLEVLDISGARATSHPAAVPLEALQKGCPKLRVFRAANSQLVLATATQAQQMECGGWTLLEELSIAAEAATERVTVGEYRLGDEALARLVRAATRLRLLDLRGLHRLSDSGLVRVPAWDLQHLFLGGCKVTRKSNSCLELICEKWSHSLLELDLSWASAERVLDTAVCALADAPHSKLRILNLCGSSVSLEPVKKILMRCPHLESLNLAACRALPRGMKRLYTGKELQDLKDSFDPAKAKTKEQSDKDDDDTPKTKGKKSKDDSKSESADGTPKRDESETSAAKLEAKSPDKSSSSVFQEPKSVSDSTIISDKKPSEVSAKFSPDHKSESSTSKDASDTPVHTPEGKHSTREPTPKLLSPIVQSKPDSSSTPRSDSAKTDLGSPHFSPVPKPDSQVQNSPEVLSDSFKSNSWNLGQFKTTPTHRSEASPLNRLDSHSRVKASKVIEQCSPTTSLENKLSPEIVGTKQDIKNPSSWNYGNYSPMTRQDNHFSSQKSPYSAQPSPAQPSPYSAQPSPYSTQQSPYSSQPSPYSAQPSPDTSQMVKSDIPKSGTWNAGNYSPMPKHHAPFSPHPSTHTSPDPGLGVKSDSIRSNPNKTPGQYSPMSRQDRLQQSPYSPRPSAETVAYNNKKSPGVGGYSPMMRQDCHLPSPDGVQSSRPALGRTQEMYGRHATKLPDVMASSAELAGGGAWGLDRFGQLGAPSVESLVWGAAGAYSADAPHAAPRLDNIPPMLNTPPPQAWPGLPTFPSSARRPNNDMSDPWTLGQFRVEPPHQVHNTFVEQNVSFDSLNASHALPHLPQSYLGDSFSGSRLE